MKKYWLLHLGFTFLLAACDWKVFDDFQKQATVQVIEPPRNFVGTNFGQVVAPALDDFGNIVPNVFLAGGNGTTPLAVVAVDDSSISQKACISDTGLPVASLTPLPASSGRWRAILSEGNYQTVNVVSFNPNEDQPHVEVKANLSGLSPLFGVATLAGDFDGDGTPDIAVVARDRLYFFDETLNTVHQRVFDFPSRFSVPNVPEAGSHIFVPFVRSGQTLLAIGGMISNDASETTWAVLLISVGTDFSLETQILQGNFSNTNEHVCSLAAGRINADDLDDLVVGICHSTFVFYAQADLNWFSAQPDRMIQESGKMRGRIVALTDLNQDGKLELAISDPEQTVDSNRNGKVLLYDLETPDAAALQLPSPSEEKRFGTSLFSLKTIWKDGRVELVVGGANASYLFFLTGLPGDDNPQLHDPRP